MVLIFGKKLNSDVRADIRPDVIVRSKLNDEYSPKTIQVNLTEKNLICGNGNKLNVDFFKFGFTEKSFKFRRADFFMEERNGNKIKSYLPKVFGHNK